MPSAGHYKPGTARVMALKPGKSAYVGGAPGLVSGYIRVVKRHHPERRFTTETREGGLLVTRLEDVASCC